MKGTYLNMKKILTINLIVLIIIHILSNVSCAINSDSRWNIYFENIEIKDGSVEATQVPTLTDSSNLEITYSVNLNLPGEFYEFTVDVVNNGNIDAMVNNVSINELSADQKRYVSYDVTYSDGTKINKYDLLKAGATAKLRIRVVYRNDITADDLPSNDSTINLSLNAEYVQADANAKDKDIKENTDNKNDESKNGAVDNKSENDKKEDDKGISKIIKSIKTGDFIIAYILILVLAIIALAIAKKKSKEENK